MDDKAVNDAAKEQMSLEDSTGAGECSASGEQMVDISPEDVAETSEGGDEKPDAEAIFRELEGLTSMMDSVTQSLISARDGGSHDVGGGGEEAAAAEFETNMKPTAPPVVGVAGFECGESL